MSLHSLVFLVAAVAAGAGSPGCKTNEGDPPSMGGRSGGSSGGSGGGGAGAGGNANGGAGGNASGGASGSGGAAGLGGAGTGGSTGGTGGAAGGSGGAGQDASGGDTPTGTGGTSGAAFAWPNNAVAAVTLTYDDGLDSHISVAAPVLDANGIKGTFFLSNFEGVDHQWSLPNLTAALDARHMAWMAMGAKGHELASHTVNHPCNAASKAPGFKLTDYTVMRMSTELDNSIARLKRLGGTEPFTFAYPCSSDTVGLGAMGMDYSSLVSARFLAARVSMAAVADPATVVIHKVPQLDTGGKTGDQLKAMVDDAIAKKGWLVLLFHGVGNEMLACGQGLGYMPNTCTINYLTTSAAAHETLVKYLAEKKAQVWTATFKEVATHVKSKRP
ncbi:MAG TPA: polysaccharide deacetylase family protein [Polyangia bacterium]